VPCGSGAGGRACWYACTARSNSARPCSRVATSAAGVSSASGSAAAVAASASAQPCRLSPCSANAAPRQCRVHGRRSVGAPLWEPWRAVARQRLQAYQAEAGVQVPLVGQRLGLLRVQGALEGSLCSATLGQ